MKLSKGGHRGLIKVRRPRKQWTDPAVPEYYETWYINIYWRGKQILRNTLETRLEDAVKHEHKLRKLLNSERWKAGIELLEATTLRAVGPTLRDVREAYLAPGITVVDPAQAKRNIRELYNVVAFAKGLWGTNNGANWRPGVARGARISDTDQVDRVQISELNKKGFVLAYFMARSEDGQVDWREPAKGNKSANTYLKMARDVFAKNAMTHKLGGLKLPDMTPFRSYPLLPVNDPKPAPLTPEEFETMVKVADEIRATEPELWLTNVFLRRTGLRTHYVEGAQADWLELHGGRWHLAIQNRPEQGWKKKTDTIDQLIPLDDELAAIFRKREGFLVAPDETPAAREKLIRERHNHWLKGMIGGLGKKGVQGNHRLRDTAGSALLTLHGVAVAQHALGHKNPNTTLKHYAKLMPVVSPVMRHELRAWGHGAEASKVVPMVA